MIRTTIFITEQQRDAIDKITKQTGVRFSEILRRALDDFVKKENPLFIVENGIYKQISEQSINVIREIDPLRKKKQNIL